MSILLACIAAKLGPTGRSDDWTAQIIRDDRLTNPGKPKEKRRKPRLQDGDEEEYRRGLEGKPAGAGAVAQAWRTARRLVARHDVRGLLKGLERFRVVSIGLGEREDPQQIFESLNATGRPLTESEKVKNWLLMGLRDDEQQDLHDNYWIEIERSLGAEHTTEPIDTFLRDVLRWRTGEIHGIDRVYDGLRRWALRQGHVTDRPALCRDLARLARLYGIPTGTAGEHRDARVERELRHLRAMGRVGEDAGGNWDMDNLVVVGGPGDGRNEQGRGGIGPRAWSKRWRGLRGAPEKRSCRTCIRLRATLPGPTAGALTMRAVPGHDQYVRTRMNEIIRRARDRTGRRLQRCVDL